MDNTDSKVFIRKYLFVLAAAIVGVILAFVIGSANLFTAIISAIILLVLLFLLLYNFVVAFGNMFKHVVDRKKEKFDYLHLGNLVLTVLAFGIYMTFYILLFAPILFQFI